MTEVRGPAPRPCGSCPYRLDVPAGIWAAEEYERLPRYDGGIAEQALAGATGVFLCHQQDGRACAGWAGCHDGYDDLLAVRLGVSAGILAAEVAEAIAEYRSPVPLFASGAEAAAHGLSGVDSPGPDAVAAIARLERRRR